MSKKYQLNSPEKPLQAQGTCYPLTYSYINTFYERIDLITSLPVKGYVMLFPDSVEQAPAPLASNYSDDGFWSGNCTF